jgi:hypothetical protein
VQLALAARRQEAQQPQAVLVLERLAEQRLEPERRAQQVQLLAVQQARRRAVQLVQLALAQRQVEQRQREWQRRHPGCCWRLAGRTSSARCSTKEAQGWAALQQDLPRATA